MFLSCDGAFSLSCQCQCQSRSCCCRQRINITAAQCTDLFFLPFLLRVFFCFSFCHFLFTEHSNFQFTFGLFSLCLCVFSSFSVIDVVLFHFLCNCCKTGNISIGIYVFLSLSLFPCVSLVLYGISTECTNTDCNSQRKKIWKNTHGKMHLAPIHTGSIWRVCVCVCLCQFIAFGWVDIARCKRKCGCKQNIYVKTTKYGENNLNILFIFVLCMKS